LDAAREHPLLEDIPTGPDGWHAYFVHSYAFTKTEDGACLATTDYCGPITAMVLKNNIVGTQFHPEKSQKLGLKLISNFLRWRP
jgi:glutamine amidotransferase